MRGPEHPTVLHYTGYAWAGGGVDAVVHALARAVPSRPLVGVSPAAPPPAPGAPRLWRGPPVAGESIDLANLWRTWRVARVVARWLRRGSHRVFHGHSRAGLLVALWLDLMGARRVVATVHCHGRHRWFYRWAKRRLGGRLWWLTPAMKRHYRLPGEGWDDCLPNGLPGAPRPLRRWPGGRELRVGGAGFLVPAKRWEVVVRALARLPQNAAWTFTQLGREFDSNEAGEYARGLRAEADAAGLGGRIRWADWRPAIAGFLDEIDVLVVPSELESFSLVALEALWAGVPVITAQGGGTEHLVTDGTSGWLFPAGDDAALAAVLQRGLVAENWRGIGGVAPGLERFRLEAIAARWSEVYAGL